MVVNNSLVKKEEQRLGITGFLSRIDVKKQVADVVGKNSDTFISSIISAVGANDKLKECEPASILSSALLGESLKLSPSPQLGHYYMVPFDNKKKGVKVAQFQLGYKGYIQLAIRSGQYKKINVVAIKKGELEYFDPLNEDIKVNMMVDDWDAREQAETIGYYAMFELVNGFRKTMYWSKKQMLAHADKYSKAFNKESLEKLQNGQIPEKEMWKYSSFWYTDFDGMAFKTMLRQLISKWGIMSIDLQKAFDSDMAEIKEDGSVEYIENEPQVEEIQQVAQTPVQTVEEIQQQESTESIQQALFE